MPNNCAMPEQRATNLKREFLKNPSFCMDYIAFVNDMITKGLAVKVPDKDLGCSNGL